MGIDYSPRDKGCDVKSLQAALRDALRQTPSVVFIGEIREDEDEKDWKHVIEFAGTGHLVVTTAHAGSLRETMEKIMREAGAKSAAERGYVAQRILAIVNIVTGKDGKRYPAFWRRTDSGVAAMRVPGLSSILPFTPPVGQENQIATLGRYAIAQRLYSGDAAAKEMARKLDMGGV
jgi:hypothetical protein